MGCWLIGHGLGAICAGDGVGGVEDVGWKNGLRGWAGCSIRASIPHL